MLFDAPAALAGHTIWPQPALAGHAIWWLSCYSVQFHLRQQMLQLAIPSDAPAATGGSTIRWCLLSCIPWMKPAPPPPCRSGGHYWRSDWRICTATRNLTQTRVNAFPSLLLVCILCRRRYCTVYCTWMLLYGTWKNGNMECLYVSGKSVIKLVGTSMRYIQKVE